MTAQSTSPTPSEGSAKRRAASRHNAEPSAKKRAPYVARACDACRRRKGRCSGEDPCAYCSRRSLMCTTTPIAANPLPVSDVMPDSSDQSHSSDMDTPSQSTSSHFSDTNSVKVSRALEDQELEHEGIRFKRAQSRTAGELEDFMSTLQQQVNNLSARTYSLAVPESLSDEEHIYFGSHTSQAEPSVRTSHPPKEQSPRVHGYWNGRVERSKCWYGPTSPDYSLNVAQERMQKMHPDPSSHDEEELMVGLVDCRFNRRALDGEAIPDDPHGMEAFARPQARRSNTYTNFRQSLTKHECLRLIHIYQQAFGDFHPVVEIQRLIRLTESLYELPRASKYGVDVHSIRTSASKDVDLMILNIMLALALRTEAGGKASLSRDLFLSSREAVINHVVVSEPTIQNATLALLVAAYYFFSADLRLAWKTCGLAGNVLLELGLHNQKLQACMLEMEGDGVQVTTVICSIIVLDRQSSAATGLPTHFQLHNFRHILTATDRLKSPYLKAMGPFVDLSDRFTSPIARIATTDQSYEEDGEFRSLWTDVEAWRHAAIGHLDLPQNGRWTFDALRTVPPWAILINLRANNAHNMLLRPFFFSNHLTPGARKWIGPATRLFLETINTIADLDQMTETYRQQMPFFIHLLISACALMALVTSYAVQHHQAIQDDLPRTFGPDLRRSHRAAVGLADTYQQRCTASRKLTQRLAGLQPALLDLGVLTSEAANSTISRQEKLLTEPAFRQLKEPVPKSYEVRSNGPSDGWSAGYQNLPHPDSPIPFASRQGHVVIGDPADGMYARELGGQAVLGQNGLEMALLGLSPEQDDVMPASSMLDDAFFQDWPAVDELNFF